MRSFPLKSHNVTSLAVFAALDLDYARIESHSSRLAIPARPAVELEVLGVSLQVFAIRWQ
jgi:hypothetical protein